MPQNPADALDGHPSIQCRNGKGVTRAVEGDVLADATALDNLRDMLGQRSVADGAEDGTFILLVGTEDMECLWQKTYLE